MLTLWLGLAQTPAWAGREPPDFRAELMASAAAQADALNADGRFDDAIAFAERFQKAVDPAADVEYEVAYAYNGKGDLDASLASYDAVISLNPHQAAARYDRGELLLVRGRDHDAEVDFEEAARLRPDHWAVHFRLAEIAGRAGDVDAFEAHLTDAIRCGFDFRTAIQDPTWHAWFHDPKLGPVLTKLVTVYGDEKLLDGL